MRNPNIIEHRYTPRLVCPYCKAAYPHPSQVSDAPSTNRAMHACHHCSKIFFYETFHPAREFISFRSECANDTGHEAGPEMHGYVDCVHCGKSMSKPNRF